MIEFTCGCGQHFHLPDTLAGQTGFCPRCGIEIYIPGGEAPEEELARIVDEMDGDAPDDRPDINYSMLTSAGYHSTGGHQYNWKEEAATALEKMDDSDSFQETKSYEEEIIADGIENPGWEIDSPTDRQLSFANDLGIVIPEEATKEQVHDMIDMKLEHDKFASKAHRMFAKDIGVHFTKYVGKKKLFDSIFAVLCNPGMEKELVAWFAFRVFRCFTHGDNEIMPDARLLSAVAHQFCSDKEVLSSIRNYREGRKLIWFGLWTSPDGYQHSGANKNTVAYKRVAKFMVDYEPV